MTPSEVVGVDGTAAILVTPQLPSVVTVSFVLNGTLLRVDAVVNVTWDAASISFIYGEFTGDAVVNNTDVL